MYVCVSFWWDFQCNLQFENWRARKAHCMCARTRLNLSKISRSRRKWDEHQHAKSLFLWPLPKSVLWQNRRKHKLFCRMNEWMNFNVSRSKFHSCDDSTWWCSERRSNQFTFLQKFRLFWAGNFFVIIFYLHQDLHILSFLIQSSKNINRRESFSFVSICHFALWKKRRRRRNFLASHFVRLLIITRKKQKQWLIDTLKRACSDSHDYDSIAFPLQHPLESVTTN